MTHKIVATRWGTIEVCRPDILFGALLAACRHWKLGVEMVEKLAAGKSVPI